MTDRGERIARNEAAYRDVNEAIRSGLHDQAPDGPRPFMCECGLLECNDLVELTVGEYEAVRAQARRFFMVDGHELTEVERIIERHERYVVAEKQAEGAVIADETDPRR